MVLGTKERITAHRLFSTERFIRSTLPVLYISGRRDFQGTGQFLSDDAYGHLATVTGALWTPQGYNLDGGDDRVSVPDSTSLDVTGSLTLEAWMKRVGAGSDVFDCLIAKYSSGAEGGRAYELYRDSVSKIGFGISNDGTTSTAYVTGKTAISNDIWYHFVGVYIQSTLTMKGYLNGVDDTLSVTGTVPASIFNSSRPVYIGAEPRDIPIAYFKGQIGEVWIYNRALTAAEIQHNYLATKWRYR